MPSPTIDVRSDGHAQTVERIRTFEKRLTRWTAGAVATGVVIILGALSVAVAIILNAV